ncbi:DUF1501 domain-containing protein [Novipirellula artificiosorum]|uniref:Sulfatase n=1 Tax=Novipirellula artificiosorum TaxID=2528016 RepID=A0A5C6DJ12_9BACT|nr:DUF1501 domain-containing protein [Novipirellula artificiosorum]TWU35887.1 hypothetical protein Poly41_36380 [Novipirellula artificiosorum]
MAGLLQNSDRRRWLQNMGMGFGALAASQLLHAEGAPRNGGVLSSLHHAAKAKRVIFLFQAGAPSQLDLFDYKPLLNERHGTELPDSVRQGQRLTGMSGNQSSLPLVGSPYKFAQHGESGAWLSELMPHTASIADELCIVNSMYTEAINHGPGVTFMQTGSMFPGRPSMGAWLDYGLGTENEDLPAFVVMVSKNKSGQPLVSRLWGSGFLPSQHQAVSFRSGKDPVLYLSNPAGIDADSRRAALDALNSLHQSQLQIGADPYVETRIAQYELAFRMQNSIPEATHFSDEPDSILDEYGKDARDPGTFAANCLLARRLVERGVRFVQLYHQGWDHHGGLTKGLPTQCRDTDQASAALVNDLKRRGLLDDTLVVWGGEFGRTNYCQGKLTANDFGRDHHPRCFTLWMAGGGIRGGTSHGETDEFGYNVVDRGVHIHDLHATLLHLLGIDHERLTFKYQGRQFRLTDVHGKVVKEILA